MSIYIPYVIGSAGLMLGNYLYNYIYEDNKLVIESTPSLTPNSFYPLPLNKVMPKCSLGVTPPATPVINLFLFIAIYIKFGKS